MNIRDVSLLIIIGLALFAWVVGFIAGAFGFFNSVKLKQYLKKNNRDRHNHLIQKEIHFSKRSPFVIFMRNYSYVQNNKDCKDPLIKQLKQTLRITYRLLFICFLSFAILLLLIFILSMIFPQA